MNLPHPRLAARLAGLITVATAATLVPAAAEASAWPGHPDRTIVKHRVLPGETATGLAVRYHAWTAELLRLNRLGSTGVIYQGQVLRIPVVVSAWRKAHGQPTKPATRPAKPATKPATHRHHQRTRSTTRCRC